MTTADETYCRLCAEPTPPEQLISHEDDVGQHSKITSKLLWINIDVTNENLLPKTICFSCFDLLERTWGFLHNVRTAQTKLNNIFHPQKEAVNSLPDTVGKPVPKDWEQFVDTKCDVKREYVTSVEIVPVKKEPSEDVCVPNLDSTDSDEPLQTVKTKKQTRKRIKKYDQEILESDIPAIGSEVVPLDMSVYTMTWDNFMWCCANCDAHCKTIEALRIHSLEIHNECCMFKCVDCGKVSQHYKSFVSHVQIHYKALRYHCDLCNKSFKMNALVKRHRAEHQGKHSHYCKSCGIYFDTLQMLEDHKAIYSKQKYNLLNIKTETELKCDVCGREFKSRSNLQSHKLVHTERARNFSCHMCGKMFYTKGALSSHILTHDDDKPYKCDFCPQSFHARGNLTSHITMHSGAKPFVCEQCGKSFRVKSHLKSHAIVHTDLMPYTCEYCNKKFRFKTRLNMHIRQHTGAKPYHCSFCHRDFTNGSNYKKHMSRRHNIDTSIRHKQAVVNGTETNILTDKQ